MKYRRRLGVGVLVLANMILISISYAEQTNQVSQAGHANRESQAGGHLNQEFQVGQPKQVSQAEQAYRGSHSVFWGGPPQEPHIIDRREDRWIEFEYELERRKYIDRLEQLASASQVDRNLYIMTRGTFPGLNLEEKEMLWSLWPKMSRDAQQKWASLSLSEVRSILSNQKEKAAHTNTNV